MTEPGPLSTAQDLLGLSTRGKLNSGTRADVTLHAKSKTADTSAG